MSEHLRQAQKYLTKAIQPTEGRLPSLVMAVQMILLHLESQQTSATPAVSEEPPVTTASPITAAEWAAVESTLRQTLGSWLSARATTESLVGPLFKYAAQQGALPDDAQILALAAQARRLTSANQGFNTYAATLPSADVTSLSVLSDTSGSVASEAAREGEGVEGYAHFFYGGYSDAPKGLASSPSATEAGEEVGA